MGARAWPYPVPPECASSLLGCAGLTSTSCTTPSPYSLGRRGAPEDVRVQLPGRGDGSGNSTPCAPHRVLGVLRARGETVALGPVS